MEIKDNFCLQNEEIDALVNVPLMEAQNVAARLSDKIFAVQAICTRHHSCKNEFKLMERIRNKAKRAHRTKATVATKQVLMLANENLFAKYNILKSQYFYKYMKSTRMNRSELSPFLWHTVIPKFLLSLFILRINRHFNVRPRREKLGQQKLWDSNTINN